MCCLVSNSVDTSLGFCVFRSYSSPTPSPLLPSRSLPLILSLSSYLSLCLCSFGSKLIVLVRVCRNQMTHWWDASQIYGPSADFAKSLRKGTTCVFFLQKNKVCAHTVYRRTEIQNKKQSYNRTGLQKPLLENEEGPVLIRSTAQQGRRT